jgi:hypothetical protein
VLATKARRRDDSARTEEGASALDGGVRALASARALRPLYERALVFQGAEDERDSEDEPCAEDERDYLK